MTVFSQSVTINDTAYLRLSKPTAKAVIAELIQGDELRSENNLLKSNNFALNSNIVIKDSLIASKDSVITLYKKRDDNFNKTLFLKDKEINEYKALSTQLGKDLKRANRRLNTSGIVTASIITLAVGVLVFK